MPKPEQPANPAEQAANQELSIFNIGQHKEQIDASMYRQKFVSSLFDPKIKAITDTMVFIIRMMPYVKNPLQSMVSKNFYAFNDQLGVFIFDSRTSFNRPIDKHYEFCPVSDTWLKLRNAPDPNVKKKADLLRQQRAVYAYVQIVANPSDPTMNGQIVPMRIPIELVKLTEALSKPSEQDLALGAIPIQVFDLFASKNIKCTVTGHKPDGVTLMRDWKVVPDGEICEAKFPLGPNNAMTPISKLDQAAVLAHFHEAQTIDLLAEYGYHEPTIDTKRRTKNVLRHIVADVPGMPEIVNGYFPELQDAMPTDQNAMLFPNQQVATGQIPGQPVPQALPVTPVEGSPVATSVEGQVSSPAPIGPGGVALP